MRRVSGCYSLVFSSLDLLRHNRDYQTDQLRFRQISRPSKPHSTHPSHLLYKRTMEPISTGRGGAGNFVARRKSGDIAQIPSQPSPKPSSGGNFSGRGGAGNHKTKSQRENLPEAPYTPESIYAAPLVYKGGRGGAGNIEAVQVNEKHQEDREIEELIRVHSELRETGALPEMPAEKPILRVD